MQADLKTLLSGVEKGDKRSASRLMTLIENEGPESDEALKRLYASAGKALVIGVTGWPGVGKSSLISRIAKVYLNEGKGVGIIAIDPTSPFSGGSLLGDRLRLREIEGSDNLFIRSAASRGHHGGLSRSARSFTLVMEAMGYDVIIIETVGIGQDQVAVSLIADTTIVVVAPGLGDHLQAIKAGVLEAGDIFVVNKADRPDAERAIQDLESAIRLRDKTGWSPPVLKTVAASGSGVEELIQEIGRHAVHCSILDSRPSAKIEAAKNEIVEALKSRLYRHFFGSGEGPESVGADYACQLCERKNDPYMIADLIIAEKGIK
jgi:LAO/AO transport system kinase